MSILCVSRESFYLMPPKCFSSHHGAWQMLSRAWIKIANDIKILRCLEMVWSFLITFCNSTGWYTPSAIVSWKRCQEAEILSFLACVCEVWRTEGVSG